MDWLEETGQSVRMESSQCEALLEHGPVEQNRDQSEDTACSVALTSSVCSSSFMTLINHLCQSESWVLLGNNQKRKITKNGIYVHKFPF